MNNVAQKNISPDWLRPAEVAARFGISRGTLYRLIQRKVIKSVSLGRDGRSTRLVHYASLIEYLEKLWDEQSNFEG
jgi:excisionase family DNA binding protein